MKSKYSQAVKLLLKCSLLYFSFAWRIQFEHSVFSLVSPLYQNVEALKELFIGKSFKFISRIICSFYLEMPANGNLNWLLHKMYLIRDFEFCKKLIEQQMQLSLNQEYLFHVKVCSSHFMKTFSFTKHLVTHPTGIDST